MSNITRRRLLQILAGSVAAIAVPMPTTAKVPKKSLLDGYQVLPQREYKMIAYGNKLVIPSEVSKDMAMSLAQSMRNAKAGAALKVFNRAFTT